MRRADRLFQIVHYLQGRRLTTATQLASWLQVSERTIYRDIQVLSTSGVPIEGESGVGYRLRKGFHLPPLMFTVEELQALTIGARMIDAWSGDLLGQQARSALAKITAAMPTPRQHTIETTRLYAPNFCREAQQHAQRFDQIHHTINQRLRCEIDYCDAQQQPSRRYIWPLALYFWGYVWTLGAWCEKRQDFRTFRLDRILNLIPLAEHYPDEQGKRLTDFLQKMKQRTEPVTTSDHADTASQSIDQRNILASPDTSSTTATG
ncbi:MAG: YafY family protein [Pseudomonadota bacterium]|nr:YafY family protein [Pseudomonadota bacterium]